MTKRLLFTALLLASCVDDRATVNAAQAIGLTDVVPGSFSPWSCGKDDVHAQLFNARNIHGAHVFGVVCCGLLKDCTVRFR